MKNIFIEGIQGSGKSTLLRLLGQQLPDYHVYMEGDYSPVDLAWCSYMTEKEYQQALSDFPDLAEEIKKRTTKEDEHYIVEYTRILAERREFYQYMERFEIYNGRKTLEEFKGTILRRWENFSGEGNVFECSFFQNIMEELLLYYQMEEQEVIAFYKEIYKKLENKAFFLIYLSSEDIKKDVLQIKQERSDAGGEMWYPVMMAYLKATPYGEKHPFEGIDDMVAHFTRRRRMELKVIEEVLGSQAIVIPAKKYQIEELCRTMQA